MNAVRSPSLLPRLLDASTCSQDGSPFRRKRRFTEDVRQGLIYIRNRVIVRVKSFH